MFGVILLWILSAIFLSIGYFTYKKHRKVVAKAKLTSGRVVGHQETQSSEEGEAWEPVFVLPDYEDRRVPLWGISHTNIHKRYPIGSIHQVFFNPQEPEFVYEKGWRQHLNEFAFLGFGIATFFFGVLGLIYSQD